jgi:hypothetical protein
VNAPEETTKGDPFFIVEFVRVATAFFGKYGKIHPVMIAKRATVPERQGRNHRDFLGCQFEQEVVLFLESGFQPPARPIKFHHQTPAFGIGKFVHLVDITVVGAAEVGAANVKGRFHQVEDDFGGQFRKSQMVSL